METSRNSDATLGLTVSVISHPLLSLCVCYPRRPMQTMQDTALYQRKADPAMQPNLCEAYRTVWDGRLTWPEVGTADLREAPAKLLQASADAILLGSAADLSKTQRFGLDGFGSDKRPALSGFIVVWVSQSAHVRADLARKARIGPIQNTERQLRNIVSRTFKNPLVCIRL